MGMIDRFFQAAAHISFAVQQRKSNPLFAFDFTSKGGWDLAQRMPLNFKGYAKEGYRRNDTVFKCISYIARNAGGVEWGLYTDRTKQKEITSHPLLDLWANPNPDQYTFDYVEDWISFYLLTGNVFQQGISALSNNPKSAPDELYVLRPDYVQIIPSETGVAGYKLGADFTTAQPVDKMAIAHSKYWCPDDFYWGLSLLEVAAIFIDQQSTGNKWNLAYMSNAVKMPGFWKTDQLLNQIDFQKLKKDLKEKYSGYKNAGNSPLFDGGVSWQEASKPPLELDWMGSSMKLGISIANLFNIDPALIGDTSASTYNNRQEAKYGSYTEAIFPCMDKLAASLNRWLVPRYGKGLYLAYKPESVSTIQEIIQQQLQAKSDRSTKIWMAGKCTLDEARDLEGLPPVPDGAGKIYRFGSVLVPEEELGKYAEQSLTKPAAPPPAAPEPLNVAQPSGQPAPQDSQDEEEKEPPKKSRYTVKALDLSTTEQKQAFMASMESTRAKWEAEVTQRIEDYFKQEHKLVVAAIDQAAIPASAEDRAELALKQLEPHFKDVISTLWQDVAQDVGSQVAKDLKNQGACYQYKAFSSFAPNVLSYLLSLAGQKVKMINSTILDLLQGVLRDGVAEGESIPQLAKRVDALYLQQIIPNRSTVIARTEVVAASNYGSHESAKQSGLTLKKVWLATGDSRTRPDHAEADGQEVGMDEPFEVGESQLMFPGDNSLGAAADEVIQCRCTQFYRRVKAPALSNEDDEEKFVDDHVSWKINPNHDHLGRFASGGGGGGSVSASGKLKVSSKDFGSAELTQFGSSANPTFKTTINGKDYFVKQLVSDEVSSSQQLQSEMLGRDLAVTGGLGNHTLPVGTVQHDGKTYMLQEWTQATPIFDMPSSKVASIYNSLSSDVATRMQLHEYILSDSDRHAGNTLYDAASGNLLSIDFGFAGRSGGSELDTFSTLTEHLSSRQPPFQMSSSALKAYAKKIPSMYSRIQKAGYSPAQMTEFRQRLGVIQYLAKSYNNPTLKDFQGVAQMGFVLEIPKSADFVEGGIG